MILSAFKFLRSGLLSAIVVVAFLAAPSARAADEWLKKGIRKQMPVFDGSDVRKKVDLEPDTRGKVTIRRLRPQCRSDWENDPTALPYLFYQLRLRSDDDTTWYVNNAGLDVSSVEIFQYPIIYFTSHFAFSFSDEEVKNLRTYLERGGTLWLDDCTGSGPFMECVPQNVQRILPGSEMKQMFRSDPAFFDLFNMVYPFAGYPDLYKEQFNRPFQAAFVRGRPAVIFCPNDYGCRWEISTPPTALNPLGDGAHGMVGDDQREPVYQFSINWLFFTLTH
jgi:hypothetical protein